MSTHSPLPLGLVLVSLFSAIPCSAQTAGVTESASLLGSDVRAAKAPQTTARSLSSSHSTNTLSDGWSDRLDSGPWTEQMARRAAHMDPGILWYVEPPAGTDMPIIRPRENVDPEMVRPVPPHVCATIWRPND